MALQQSADLNTILAATFGFPAFRPNQFEVCAAAAAGHDVLLVMPTGAGKSLCYQVPALARGGTALVISPLIALMDDQVAKLRQLGLHAGAIHSGVPREDARQLCRDYLNGSLQFMLIAPERLRVPGFVEMLAKRPLALIAIDEAHCISHWGHDFRPDYRNLAQHIQSLRPAPVIALTATATPAVQQDIIRQLGLRDARRFVHGFRRQNLAIQALETPRSMRSQEAVRILEDPANLPAIVYAQSRKDAEQVAADLRGSRIQAACYHAGLESSQREQVQRGFLAGKYQVVVATVAFGMGIDKADVRTVLHLGTPASIEGYSQEIGRAGRDGLPSRAILLHSFEDRRIHDFFLERDYPAAELLARIAAQLSPTPRHADEVRAALQLSMEDFEPALDKLLSQGAAQMDMAGNLTSTGMGRREWQQGYSAQVDHRRSALQAMQQLAQSTACRMSAIVAYFGDTEDARQPCGVCDNCAGLPDLRDVDADELRECYRVLDALGNGNARSLGKLYSDLQPREKLPRRSFDALLEALARAGYLQIEAASFESPEGRTVIYRTARATHEGREAAAGAELVGVQVRTTAAAPGSKDKSSSRSRRDRKSARSDRKSAGSDHRSSAPEAPQRPLSAEQEQAEQALRAWRKKTAAALHQPAFCVFGDKTLRAIAEEMPRDFDDLRHVHGVGPVKAERWGDEIFSLLRAIC